MDNYIVTCSANLGRDVICSPLEVKDLDGRHRRIEIIDKDTADKFVTEYRRDFPHCAYRIYRLVEVE